MQVVKQGFGGRQKGDYVAALVPALCGSGETRKTLPSGYSDGGTGSRQRRHYVSVPRVTVITFEAHYCNRYHSH